MKLSKPSELKSSSASDGPIQSSAWTGGQYSLFRCLLGLYLCVHFAQLIPWGAEVFSNIGALPDSEASPLLKAFPNLFLISDHPAFVTAVLSLGVLGSLCICIGWRDRIAALLVWWIWASLFGRNPLISNPSLPYVGVLLLAHALLARVGSGADAAPYGAWSMRGRLDPGGHWCMPRALWRTVWILMSVGYSYSGYTKLVSPSWRDGSACEHVLNNPLTRPGGLGPLLAQLPSSLLQVATYGALAFELSFAALALVARLRPWAWASMLIMHVTLIFMIDFADLSLGMLLLHLFTFDPAWLRGNATSEPELLFYDGDCGLCHRAVRFALAEDKHGERFHFAPLQSPILQQKLKPEQLANLPDSLLLLRADGALLVRSDAVAHLLKQLGGLWWLLGGLLTLIPRRLRDFGYDLMARYRQRFFSKPQGLCPLLPRHLGERFH